MIKTISVPTFNPQLKPISTTQKYLVILLSSFIIALFAQVSIPLEPVPITLQNFAILGISMVLGPRYGMGACALYLLEGALGAPVFANGKAGLITLSGPTAGYLWSFILMAGISGFLAKKLPKHFISYFLSGAIGLIINFTLGAIFLAQHIGYEKAYSFGVQPFIISDVLKLLFLSFCIPSLLQALKTKE
ncbi:MAG: biotin biosynthesis protein BioY [Francisellaceae bacterium]|nr:biotin biosynthesis protein BioY [Francisellaceae bacterium]